MEKRELNETTKIYAIRQIVPDELEKNIVGASTTLTSYEQVRAYINEQVAIRRDIKSTTHKAPVQMELNLM